MMPHSLPTSSIFLAILTALALPAEAQITYVDAAPSNMARLDGQALTPATGGNVYTDANWSLRTATGLASNDTIYEAGGGETVPTLIQTVTGLAPGLYEVHAYFWVATHVNWQISTSLGNIQYATHSGTHATQGTPITFNPASANLQFVPAADLTNGTFGSVSAPTQAIGGADRTLARHHLGTHWVGASGSLIVHVRNGPVIGSAANSRTWYDGLGYAPAAGSTPIIGSSWAAGLGSPALSAPTRNSLVWGDNSANNADNTAVHATIDADAATSALEPVNLADGQTVRLSGKINLQTSITNTTGAAQFRWGLFNHNGSPDSAGWTGYWAGNGTSGNAGALFRQRNTSTLYVSANTANGSYLSTTINKPGAANLAAGVYDFNLVITRTGTEVQLSAAMTRESDGAVLAEMTGSDNAGYRDFTRIGFLSGSLLDADQISLYGLALEYPYAPPPPPVPGEIAEVAPDGAWTWFNDERAIWHQGMLFTGYVRRDGNPGVTRYNHLTGAANHTNLGTATSLQVDDHNNPSFTALPDGRLLAVYSKHGTASQFYHRISATTSPSSLAQWGAETIKTTPAGNTYANTYRLAGPGP
ncbi:MAG: BNR repeat-containing protein, partial [Akkermansiaceae bacterium]|nr:BNR repeat-containing protein [Akkermansiaceae bacterium]